MCIDILLCLNVEKIDVPKKVKATYNLERMGICQRDKSSTNIYIVAHINAARRLLTLIYNSYPSI
jgi:hypothetical protein